MSQSARAQRWLDGVRYGNLLRALETSFELLAARAGDDRARFTLDALADARFEFLSTDLPRDWARYLGARSVGAATGEAAGGEPARFVDRFGRPRPDALRGALAGRARSRTIDAYRRGRHTACLADADAAELPTASAWEERLAERLDARALAPRLLQANGDGDAATVGVQGLIGVHVLGVARREVAAQLGVPDGRLAVYMSRSAARMRAEGERLRAA